jgi:hypothetical protein
MQPGQIELNDLEVATLQRLALTSPSLDPLIGKIRVLSREFTGVGSYTNFQCPDTAPDLGDRKISLEALISMPNVPHGMGAILFCENGKPTCLEIFVYGDGNWDGLYEGYSIEETQ